MGVWQAVKRPTKHWSLKQYLQSKTGSVGCKEACNYDCCVKIPCDITVKKLRTQIK